jgi:hypothetical protein
MEGRCPIRRFDRYHIWQPNEVMKHLFRKFAAWASRPTANPGTASKPDDEVVKLLRSIDKRLATLESCVRKGIAHKPNTNHIVTGRWSD